MYRYANHQICKYTRNRYFEAHICTFYRCINAHARTCRLVKGRSSENENKCFRFVEIQIQYKMEVSMILLCHHLSDFLPPPHACKLSEKV